MKLILIGFACSYKTSVGKLLAERLQIEHIDTDFVVEASVGLSIPQIFAAYGEQYFRKTECRALFSLANRDNAVISCGGGSPLQDGFDALAKDGKVVWLTVNAQSVKQRLSGCRPLFDGKSVEELDRIIKRRNPYYAKYADIALSTDGLTSVEVADKLCGLLL